MVERSEAECGETLSEVTSSVKKVTGGVMELGRVIGSLAFR